MPKPTTPADAAKIDKILADLTALEAALEADDAAREALRAKRDDTASRRRELNDQITALTHGMQVKRNDRAKLSADLKAALG